MSSKKSPKRLKDLRVSSDWFFNKYVMTASIFLVWISFFDNHNLKEQREMDKTINRMEAQIEDYKSKFEDIRAEEQDLAHNIEKLAREKYKFGAANEDIFIIEPKK